MKKYELNNLGPDWIYEADNEDEATLKYISDVLTGGTYQFRDIRRAMGKYKRYIKNVPQEVLKDATITWKEV